jgi:hypothetical protein
MALLDVRTVEDGWLLAACPYSVARVTPFMNNNDTPVEKTAAFLRGHREVVQKCFIVGTALP